MEHSLVRPSGDDDLPALLSFFAEAPWLASEVRLRDAELHLRAGSCWLAERAGRIVAAALVDAPRHPAWQAQIIACADPEALDEDLGRVLALADRAGQEAGACPLTYIGDDRWLAREMPALGFGLVNRIVFYQKHGRTLPEEHGPAPARIRQAAIRRAATADLPAALAVDHAAFEPMWWNSTAFLQQALAQFRFVVAEAAGVVVGYSLSSLYPEEGHLARVAVRPDWQGRGIGAQLVRDALGFFWESGLERVLLNTQQDNARSQALYRRFGFRADGPTMPVWQMRRARAGPPGAPGGQDAGTRDIAPGS